MQKKQQTLDCFINTKVLYPLRYLIQIKSDKLLTRERKLKTIDSTSLNRIPQVQPAIQLDEKHKGKSTPKLCHLMFYFSWIKDIYSSNCETRVKAEQFAVQVQNSLLGTVSHSALKWHLPNVSSPLRGILVKVSWGRQELHHRTVLQH